MNMLGDIRRFIGRWIKNPIVIGIVAYIIYKTLQKYVKQESVQNQNMIENIKIIQKKGNEEVIFDTETNMYSRIKNDDIVETSNKIIKI